MKKYLFLIVTFITALTATTAQANQDFYVGGITGLNWVDTFRDTHLGYMVGGSVGYRLPENFRVEAEVSYRNNRFKKESSTHTGRLTTVSYMAHLLYDFPCSWVVQPYAGFGLGYAHQKEAHKFFVDEDTFRDHFKRNGFAWDLIAGVAVPVCNNIDLDFQYRYFHNRARVEENSLCTGLRYQF